MPRSSCFHRALLPSGPLDGALRCPLGASASGPSPQRSHHLGARALRFLCGGAVDLVFFLLLLEEHDLMEVGALLPLLGFKDFHHAARLHSPASGHLQG
jgi:hypothetical protein